MLTRIEVETDLIAEAMAATGAATEREAVEEAIRYMIVIAKQRDALAALKGIGWQGDLEPDEGSDDVDGRSLA